MKYRVVGWTHWESCEVEDSGNTIGFAERNAIIDDIVKHRYNFSGYDHQEMDCCAPVLNDGKKRTYSQRGWGGVMAEANGMMGDYDYAVFSFQTGDHPKYPCDEFDPYTFTPEDDLNEELCAEVSAAVFLQAKKKNPFFLDDVDELRFADRGDLLVLRCGENEARFLVEDIGRSKTTAKEAALIGTKYKIIATAKPLPAGATLEKKRRYSYFAVSGAFEPENVIARIGITPDSILKAGDTLPGGRTARATTLLYCIKQEENAGDMDERLTATVAPFMDKLELLYALREELSLRYDLELGRQPMGNLYIAPPDVSRFLCLSGAVHDVDYSVF